MIELRKAPWGCFLLPFIVACTSGIPYRTVKLGEETAACRQVFHQNDEDTAGEGVIDPRHAASGCWKQSAEEHAEYDLLTIEYDDQGWLQRTAESGNLRPDHLDDLLAKLKQIYNENQKNGLSIVLYVHGWHHNADARDSDVAHLRKFLGQLNVAENGRALSGEDASGPRRYAQPADQGIGPRVVGIYVGWRGESIEIPWLNALTFWDRKATAEQVAAGSVRELIQELDFVRDCGRSELDWDGMRARLSAEDRQREGKVGNRTVRMLTIGHSFGGLIAHRATSSEFIGYAVRASDRDFASRLGDLVVLVNPAFEGARYEPLHVAGRRIESLKKDQLPTLIVATTSADKATRYAFPVARWLNTLFETTEGAEQDANVLAIGHNPRYRTHALATCDPKTDPRCRVACQPSEQRLQQASKALSTVKAEVLGEVEAMEKLGNEGFQQDTTYLCHGLKLDISPAPQVPPYNPYWVVTTTGDVMDGHNNIFNPNFVAFFRQMYVAVTAARVRNPATYRCVR